MIEFFAQRAPAVWPELKVALVRMVNGMPVQGTAIHGVKQRLFTFVQNREGD